jgi:hypothetical protein
METMMDDIEIGMEDRATTTKPVKSQFEIDDLASLHHGMVKDYELGDPNSARALHEAEENNLIVVFPSESELQLDLDTEHAFNIYLALKPIIEKYYGIKGEKVAPSRSGLPKRHVTVTLYTRLTSYERIALQAILGSDRVRELLSAIQEMQGDQHPTLFLENRPTEG